MGLCDSGFEAGLSAAAPAELLHTFLVQNHLRKFMFFFIKDYL